MPRVTWSGRADWLRFYRVVKNGVEMTYGDDRTWAPSEENPELLHRADALIALGMAPTDRVLIAGAGLGFLVEALKMRGMVNVWGLDSSTYVQTRRGEIAHSGTVLVNVDMTQGAAVSNALNGATGFRTFHWVVSESVLESYDDAEITVLCNAAEGLLVNGVPSSHIVHLVYASFNDPDAAATFNVKTMAQWKAMRPAHTWMNAEGYAVQP